MPAARKFRLAFILLVVLYLLYAGSYIYRSSFVVEGERYFVLNDDAMISMRYAHNLARGDGLVWNIGERVEGFSNPLWTVYMAFWHLLPIPASKMSLPIQLTGMVLLALNLVFVRRIALKLTGNEWIALSAASLTAFYKPLNNWGLLGMEVSLLVLLVSAAVWAMLRAIEEEHFDRTPYLLLGLGTLVRFDMAVPLLVLLLANLYFDRAQRRQHLTYGLGALAIGLGLQTGFRLAYYGEWLPNTYYLKLTGIPTLVRIANGFTALLSLMWNTGWALALLPFTLLFFRRDRATVTLILLFLGQAAYSVYVGGDAWEHNGGANRYISLAIPLFFILLAYAGHTILDRLVSADTSKRFPRAALVNAAFIFIVLLTMLQANSTLESHRSISCCPLRVSQLTRSGLSPTIDFTVANEDYVRIARALDAITTPEARIAVVAAGAIPYFTDLPAVDLLGKSDAHVARTEAHLPNAPLARLTAFRPGHSKWDYAYSLGQLQPDIVVQLWDDADEAQAFLQEYVVVSVDEWSFTAKANSPHILWESAQLTISSE